MLIDRYHGMHTASAPDAVAAFEAAVFAVAAHRSAARELQTALDHDADLIAAHALKGFGAILLGRSDTVEPARRAYAAASRSAALKAPITEGEAALLNALGLAISGGFKAGAACLEAHLERHPRDFLHAKIAHALRFMLGDKRAMLKLTARLTARIPEDDAGFGFLMGCHAFGLEECGAYREAEISGKCALSLQPDDSWGLHAVSHVYEMTGRVFEGSAWLEASRPVWSRCNNFSFHMAWHLALFHLEKGDHDAVLNVYDREIRPEQTDDFRDMANAVSTLWRLEQEGVNCGARWDGLADIAERRSRDVTYIFASLHYLLALIASGRTGAAADLVEALADKAQSGVCDQAHVADDVGLPLAMALMKLPAGDVRQMDLHETAARLPCIGGSNAQRDVFLRSLMILADRSGDCEALRAVSRLRREQRHADRFQTMMLARSGRLGTAHSAMSGFASHRALMPLAGLV